MSVCTYCELVYKQHGRFPLCTTSDRSITVCQLLMPACLLVCLLGARLQLLIDLVNHRSSVLPFESRKEIRLLTPSHDGRLLLVLDVDGRALLVNLQRRVVLHRFNFKKKVRTRHGAWCTMHSTVRT